MGMSILVAVDFSDVTDMVLEAGCRLAGAMGAKMWLIHVATADPELTSFEIEIGKEYPRDLVAGKLRREHQRLQEHWRACIDKGLDVTAMLVHGAPGDKIVQESRRLDVHLIVLGSHGHGALHHLLVGSVCEGMLRQATCPVLIVPSKVLANHVC